MKALSAISILASVLVVSGCSNPPEEFGTRVEERDRIENALGIECENRGQGRFRCDWQINIWSPSSSAATSVTISKESASVDRVKQLSYVYGFSDEQVENVVTSDVDLEIAGSFRLRNLRQQYRIDETP